MNITDPLILALAVKAVLDLWFDEDSVLADWRARTQLWESWFWRTLFNCRFCMTHWVAAGLLVPLAVSVLAPDPWALAARGLLYALAVIALVVTFERLSKRPTPAPESVGASTITDMSACWRPIDAHNPPPDTRVLLCWTGGRVRTGWSDAGSWRVESPTGAHTHPVYDPPAYWQPIVPPKETDVRTDTAAPAPADVP